MSTSTSVSPGRDRSNDRRSPGLWRAIAGFGIWTVAFVVLYVGHAVACLYVFPGTTGAQLVREGLGAIWLAHVAVLGFMAWRSARLLRYAGQAQDQKPGSAEFLLRLTVFLDVFALGAVFVNGLPVVLMKACEM